MENLLKFQQQLLIKKIDVAIIQNPINIGYLTQFYSDPHERIMLLFVFSNEDPILFVPALDFEKAVETLPNVKVISYLDSENPWKIISTILARYTNKKISVEKNYITLKTYKNLQLPSLEKICDISELITLQKLIKNTYEIEQLKLAGKSADLAIQLATKNFKVGKSELAIIADLEYGLKQQGVSQMSFDTMVLSQKNAANPHGEPSQNTINYNEFILVDLGTIHNGYCSDITRTIFFGDTLSDKQKDIYNIVLEAHHTAKDAAKIGMSAHDLDTIARQVITKYGYGDYFTHRLGHGIGQSIHEFPSISQNQQLTLQENMCFSIEPGIYIPGEIGVRIEDCFVLTKNGLESFTHSPYDLDYRKYL